jgi:hypothetical protein
MKSAPDRQVQVGEEQPRPDLLGLVGAHVAGLEPQRIAGAHGKQDLVPILWSSIFSEKNFRKIFYSSRILEKNSSKTKENYVSDNYGNDFCVFFKTRSHIYKLVCKPDNVSSENYGWNWFVKSTPGVDVMITIFGDFWQFSAKKLAFFSKTNVMINILHNLALFWVKNANFFAEFFGENI